VLPTAKNIFGHMRTFVKNVVFKWRKHTALFKQNISRRIGLNVKDEAVKYCSF
jgi:hypothetical protein